MIAQLHGGCRGCYRFLVSTCLVSICLLLLLVLYFYTGNQKAFFACNVFFFSTVLLKFIFKIFDTYYKNNVIFIYLIKWTSVNPPITITLPIHCIPLNISVLTRLLASSLTVPPPHKVSKQSVLYYPSQRVSTKHGEATLPLSLVAWYMHGKEFEQIHHNEDTLT